MSRRDCWGWWGNEAKDDDADEANGPMLPRGHQVIEADMANEANETDEAKAEVTKANEANEADKAEADEADIADKAEKAVVAFTSDKDVA